MFKHDGIFSIVQVAGILLLHAFVVERWFCSYQNDNIIAVAIITASHKNMCRSFAIYYKISLDRSVVCNNVFYIRQGWLEYLNAVLNPGIPKCTIENLFHSVIDENGQCEILNQICANLKTKELIDDGLIKIVSQLRQKRHDSRMARNIYIR